MKYDFVVLQFSTPTKERADVYVRTLGAEKTAWAADRAGYKSICIGRLGYLTEDQTVEVVSPYVSDTTIIGISTSLMTPSHNEAILTDGLADSLRGFISAVNRLIKASNRVVLGGPSASEFARMFKNADVLDTNDGENDVVQYLNRVLNHGLSRRVVDPWTIHTDDFRFPDQSFVQPEEMLPLEVSRGCIFSCKFCSFSMIGKRKGSYEKGWPAVRAYLVDNYERFGTQSYFFTSDTVNDNDERMNEWCDLLESLPFQIKYTGFFRIDLMHKHRDTTKRLYQTGLRGMNFGIETFHEQAARLIEKPFSGPRAKDFLLELYHDIFHEQAVITTGMIIGLPPEPASSVLESAEWFNGPGRVIQPSWNTLGLPCPIRGPQGTHYKSKFALNAEKYGFRWPKENVHYWEHDTMTKFQAAKLYLRIINNQTPRVPEGGPGSWNHIQHMACGNDYSFIDRYFEALKTHSQDRSTE